MAISHDSTRSRALSLALLDVSDRLNELVTYLQALTALSPDDKNGLLPEHFHSILKPAISGAAEVSGLLESVLESARVAVGGAE